MVIGYLINVYPANSHSFIRREIAAVEALGNVVCRYSIRDIARDFRRSNYSGKMVDAADEAERARTQVVLRAGAPRFALAVAAALARPVTFARSLWLAIRVGRRSAQGVLRHLAYLAEACLVLRWCRRDGVDHLHAHFATNPAAVAMLCHSLGGPRFSFTAHGPETFDGGEFLALDEKLARAAFAVAISYAGRSALCRWSDPAHWSRIHVVHCGVDEQILQRPRVSAPEAPRLVCVARLSPEKGHVSLLEAVRRVVDQGRAVELVLVGDGSMRGDLEALVAKLGLGAHVRFAGWRDGKGVIDEIVASRALVVASFSEGLPVVLMEALALGRPGIATQIAGIPELVEAGVTGWLVPPSHEEALAAAMSAALDATPAELDRMGRAGAERVAAHHDARIEGARLAALFAAAKRQGTVDRTPAAVGLPVERGVA